MKNLTWQGVVLIIIFATLTLVTGIYGISGDNVFFGAVLPVLFGSITILTLMISLSDRSS